jgi:hypothetical protein
MDANERSVIDELFGRLRKVAADAGPRDPQADALIRERMAENPAAAYHMAQTVVVQEQALEQAQARIAELERGNRTAGSGGFLSGLFGGGREQPAPSPRSASRSGLPHGGVAQPGRGGGFLASAASTAVGVAGGMMLANMLTGAFGADEAEAAAGDAGPADEGDVDHGGGDFDDAGGDFGDLDSDF